MSAQETNGSELESAELKNAEPKYKTIFFSHDTNAFMDPKIRELVADSGITAYGIWWVIVEMLASQRDYKIRIKSFCDGLHPLVQGVAFKFVDDSEGGHYVRHGSKVLQNYLEVGRHLIGRGDLEVVFNFMFEVGLLETDGQFFWAPSLDRRMRIKEGKAEAKKNAKSEAGKKSGEVRRQKKEQREAEQRQSEDGQDQEAEIK